MKTYKLSKEYNYVIYGAAFLGVQILTGLRNSGYNVNAFLDKRASELKEVEGVKVYEPQSYKSDNKENVVVIVAVTTTFEHPKIATYLRTLGYHKIICKMDENAGLVADNLKKIAYAYDKILESDIDENVELREWMASDELYYFKDYALITEDCNYIVAYIPVELCYTGKDDKGKDADTLILYSQIDMIDLYKFFDGHLDSSEGTINFLKKYFYENTDKYCSFNRTEQGFHDFVVSNYEFYSKMSYLANMGMSFFIDNPISVYWNDKGYFNIDDISKVNFIIAKGLRYIQAKMEKEDYMKWKNQEKLQACEKCIVEMNCLPAYAPILHPNFMGYPTKRDTIGNTRLSRIMKYLYRKGYELKGKKIIDIGAYYSFFAQAFQRQGADVTTIEVFESSYEAGKKINDLLRCSQINALQGDIMTTEIKDKFDVTNLLTVFYPYFQEGRGKNFIKKVSDFTNYMLIWESGGNAQEEIQFILENSDFIRYEKIGETYGTGLLREMGVFYKK